MISKFVCYLRLSCLAWIPILFSSYKCHGSLLQNFFLSSLDLGLGELVELQTINNLPLSVFAIAGVREAKIIIEAVLASLDDDGHRNVAIELVSESVALLVASAVHDKIVILPLISLITLLFLMFNY